LAEHKGCPPHRRFNGALTMGTAPSNTSAGGPPPGCRFGRCPCKVGKICEDEGPPIRRFGDGHRIACLPGRGFLRMDRVIVLDEQAAA